MVNALKIFVLLFIFIICPNDIHGNDENDCEEHLEFYLDVSKWKQAFKNSNEQASIVEFTLKNEKVENWSELVTVQKFPPLGSTVEQYYQEFIRDLENTVSPDQVYSRVIKKNDNTVLFEWWISEKSPFAQHEWFKLIQTPHSTMILRYTTKKLDQVEKVRSTWEKILDSATTECNSKIEIASAKAS